MDSGPKEIDVVTTEVIDVILDAITPSDQDTNPTYQKNAISGDPNEIDIALEEEEDSGFVPTFNIYDVRKAKSIASIASSDAGDLSSWSESGDEIDPATISDEDSDVEFEKYLQVTATRRKHTYMSEHHPIALFKKSKVQGRFRIQDEFENLPPLDKLSIHCDEKIHLAKLGVVESIVGCLVVVKNTANCSPLDLDTILFDKDRNAIGPVADVIGTFKEPVYCIRFNSNTEAALVSLGTEVYYAPKNDEYTKRVTQKEMKTPWKKSNPQIESDDEPLFSDDEKEKQYKSQKPCKNVQNNNTRNRNNPNQKRVHFSGDARSMGDSANPPGPSSTGHLRRDWHRKRSHDNSVAVAPHQNTKKAEDSSSQHMEVSHPPVATASNELKQNTVDKGAEKGTQPMEVSHSSSVVTTNDEVKKEPVEYDNPYAEFGCYGNFSLFGNHKN